MALLRAREQLDFLDRYAGVLAERAAVAGLVRELRTTREDRKRLIAEEREAARMHDMLRHEVAEIDSAELREDEEAELLVQRERLQHVERLRQAALTAYQALTGNDDGDQVGATDLLSQAVSACHDAGKIDPALAAEAEAIGTALIQAEESARTLRDYLDSLEADPQTLEKTAERLFLIGDLKRKYGESVREILVYAAGAQQRLSEIERRSDRLEALRTLEEHVLADLAAKAAALSQRRRATAIEFSNSVERELEDLRLSGARFGVSITQIDEADLSGIDRVEFLLAASAADEPRALARVASGGELARIALALKTVLSRAETRPTLIFDEIDVGVGGRTAPVVGEKLWAVAADGHQVLCVTHLAQVAAFADCHYVVAKAVTDAGAATHVGLVEGEERIEELSTMLAGASSEASRQNARELLDRATVAKRQ
jgi:DNA repair protein RecN (Recombination protein N)